MPGLALNSGLHLGLAPLPGVVGGGTPTPTPSAVISSVNADGYTAEWRTGTPPAFTPDTAPETINVTRQGYQAAAGFPGSVSTTTYSDTVVPTLRARLVAPNDATLSPTTVILSDYVYPGDTIAGVTIGSTEASPKPVMQWCQAGRRLIDTNGDQVHRGEVIASHRDGVAAVVVILRDVNGLEVQQTITAEAYVQRSGEPFGVQSFQYAIDASTLANGLIRRRALVYPYFGAAGSVLDTNDLADESRGASTRLDWKGPRYYVYVDAGGNDTTGTVSTSAATAAGAPVATLGGAIARARVLMPGNRIPGLSIRPRAGSWNFNGSTFNTYHDADTAEVIVERDPTVAKASVIFSYGAVYNNYCKYLRLRDLTFERTANVNFGGDQQLVLETVTVSILNTPSTALQSGSTKLFFENVDFTPTGAALGNFLFATNVHMVRGVTGGVVGAVSQVMNFHIAGCKILGAQCSSNAQPESGGLCVESYLSQPTNGTNPVLAVAPTTGTPVGGYAIRNAVTEFTTTGAGNPTTGIRVSSDAAGGDATHIIMQNVSSAGADNAGRWNIGYDESTGTSRRTHKLWRVEGCTTPQTNNKSDRFVHYTQANADAPNRTGAWSVMYGVGFRDNLYQWWAADDSYAGQTRSGSAGSFSQEYGGLNLTKATTVTRINPLFTAPACTTSDGTTYTAGAGNGDYTLQSGSPLKAKHTIRRSSAKFDLAGTTRGAVGATTSIGAYV